MPVLGRPEHRAGLISLSWTRASRLAKRGTVNHSREVSAPRWQVDSIAGKLDPAGQRLHNNNPRRLSILLERSKRALAMALSFNNDMSA
ncbi:hypothetical protein GCM10009038_25300 [Salinicola rhizosphaerae]|uniref:Uncharacterized protein n=1 Tax=Salinicola rhizosphaerae TaxID=1443141 RepID=A0ABQ3E3Z9_9GAMM|nr:hypothetical protein GCM10009038_25300 [Salinicola rhizosphaerae]